MDQTQPSERCRLEITGDLDRAAAEALQLEIRRLAKRHGISVRNVKIEITRDEG